MKKIILLFFTLTLMILLVACSSSSDLTFPTSSFVTPDETDTMLPLTTTPPDTMPTAVETLATYEVIISTETADGTVDLWKINGVFAEGTFMSDGFPLRVFYVTEKNSAIILSDFEPSDYPYTGAYHDNKDGSFSHDHSQLEKYGYFETYTDNYGDQRLKAGGGYSNLPKGSWFFGDVRYSNSFFIVVADKSIADQGIVPSM